MNATADVLLTPKSGTVNPNNARHKAVSGDAELFSTSFGSEAKKIADAGKARQKEAVGAPEGKRKEAADHGKEGKRAEERRSSEETKDKTTDKADKAPAEKKADTDEDVQDTREAAVIDAAFADDEDGKLLPEEAPGTAIAAEAVVRIETEGRRGDVGRQRGNEPRFSDMARRSGNDDRLVMELRQQFLGNGESARGEGKAGRAGDFLAELNLSTRTAVQNTANQNGAAMGLSTAAPQTEGSAGRPSTTLSVSVPMRKEGWDQAFGQRIMWMAKNGVQQAQIQVNPKHLGPVDIKVSVQNDQATVNFVAHNSVARDAIESAIPRLREMMAEQGLNLADSQVADQGQRQQGAESGEGEGRGGLGNGGEDGDSDGEAELSLSRINEDGSRAVDYFA